MRNAMRFLLQTKIILTSGTSFTTNPRKEIRAKFAIQNLNNNDAHNLAENKLYDFFRGKTQFDDLKNLEHLRNAVLHGSDSHSQMIRKTVENVEEFKQIFESGINLVDGILK